MTLGEGELNRNLINGNNIFEKKNKTKIKFIYVKTLPFVILALGRPRLGWAT